MSPKKSTNKPIKKWFHAGLTFVPFGTEVLGLHVAGTCLCVLLGDCGRLRSWTDSPRGEQGINKGTMKNTDPDKAPHSIIFKAKEGWLGPDLGSLPTFQPKAFHSFDFRHLSRLSTEVWNKHQHFSASLTVRNGLPLVLPQVTGKGTTGGVYVDKIYYFSS